MARPQLPRLSDILTPGIDALTALRPRAALHIPNGRYGAVVEGLAAQAAICRARLASEIESARLELAELGQPLYDLAAEFGAIVDPTPQKAIGAIAIRRSTTNNSPANTGNFGTFGFVPKGSRFRRPADTAAWPPRQDALYTAIEPVLIPDEDTATVALGGLFQHFQDLTIPIIAEREGPHANTVILDGLQSLSVLPGEIVDPLFDSRFSVLNLTAAGGTLGPTKAQVIAYAKAVYTGQYGPNDRALIAGAYASHPGVKRTALMLDAELGIARLWISDESWGGSASFVDLVGTGIRRDWLGWGARAALGYVTNVLIAIRATIILNNRDAAGHIVEITENVRSKVTAYFDDREDFWAWKLSTLRGVIARADRRILTCDSVQVLGTNGATITEPSSVLVDTPKHYMLSGSPMKLDFEFPS